MVRKFIVDSVSMFVRLYGVDGFRFDLMGDMDIETLNQVKQAVGPDVLIYGEGWNMPSALPEGDRACIENQDKMPHISHFNDRYRNAFRGTSANPGEQGLIFGRDHQQPHLRDLLFGSPHIFNDIHKSLNYIECHDNHTFYDWLKYVQHIEDEDRLRAACSAGLAAVLLAFGAPFIHAGQEFMRTKNGAENTYNAPDAINRFDWELTAKNANLIEFTRTLIRFRKAQPEYRLDSLQLAKEVTYTENTPNVVELRSDSMRIFMNFSHGDIPIEAIDDTFTSNLPIAPGTLKKHQVCFKGYRLTTND
jgi:pullulanase